MTYYIFIEFFIVLLFLVEHCLKNYNDTFLKSNNIYIKIKTKKHF